MDEKLKSENMQKEQFSEWGWGRCRERRYAYHTFIPIYFRMHHFVQILVFFCVFIELVCSFVYVDVCGCMLLCVWGAARVADVIIKTFSQ